jgi:thymidylate kinase
MLIVLEGCDGSGKTTIAKNLKAILPDAEIIHCTTTTPNTYEFFRDLILASQDRDIIADRFCYGQFVYQSEEERHLTPDQLHTLEVGMIAAGAKVIHVTAPVQTIAKRLSWRSEKTMHPISEITSKYCDLFEHTLIKPHLWWTGSDVD